ncbi:F-box/WD repeat-containing protein pof10 [Chaetomidium leptoderma]|uniref:F-box/WD repeat-containing protein pof10 n=1 Tax=Chaetomidium leptoderma TaxID=669021 RepID=A0AAN7A0U3_9PEZI|nr:F-box/WD repeat-containing protein pof10 [Chaetomidium leptoderma]
MQSGLIETPNHDPDTTNTPLPQLNIAQHGPGRSQSSVPDARPPLRPRSTSLDAQRCGGVASDGAGLDIGQLDHTLDQLSFAESESAAAFPATVAGQRISDYENAAFSSSHRNDPRNDPRLPLAFKVTHGSRSDGVQLTDFPNEILTQILSHLHPDSHGAVALVSKRFYALVTTPYAWRAAFLRYFAGQDALLGHAKADQQVRDGEASDAIRSEVRYFTRLTALASWRSEYLLRTRLLRSVARGKPGSIGSSARSSQSGGKKANAVLTFNSKLPWMISHVHADFTGGKKGPRVIHGTRDLGVATASDPTTGRIEKWGLDDPFSFQQLDEIFPNLEFYGVGEGPAAVPNVMDVSQPYGFVGGEGFPGGRMYFKAAGQLRGHYLGHDDHVMVDTAPEIPEIPGLTNAISHVWIAKSSNVTCTTQSMVGIMAGSTLGVVTSYALGHESTGPRYGDGDITARWVLCPGVPIIDIKVDDQYCLRRKSHGRVWAVALNALGEVYYLAEPPSPPLQKGKAEDAVKDAWNAGRTVYWELIESTRRTASPDEFDKNAVSGTYSPRSSANAMNLAREQVVAEAREIEQFFRHTPAHFKKVCQGWDMLRKLEVDFAAGGENGGGEAIFVITCGSEEGPPASVCRLVKAGNPTQKPRPSGAVTPIALPTAPRQSIFGGEEATAEVSEAAPQGDGGETELSPPVSGSTTPRLGSIPGEMETEEWRASEFVFKHNSATEITASAVDMSTYAVMTAFEDPLVLGSSGASTPGTPTSKHATGEIPGRRARLLAIGTNNGAVVVWNMRDAASPVVNPLRAIHTESPEITALAVSALYLVHGGSDSLVQAWDPLASSLEPIRTLNGKSSGRIPRHILHANPALQHANYFSVRCIFLDPDPAVLRGILAFGTFIRFWTYSSTNQGPGRKRRLRHADMHGRPAGRRNNGTVSSYIAAEEAELRHEQEHRSREIARLRKRFGVGMGELTEEEALQYAQMISEESLLLDEQRRASASASDDTGGGGETASSTGGSSVADTVTPEPSLSGIQNGAGPSGSSGLLPVLREEGAGGGGDDDDYEAQIQRAIRLSLMEGVNNNDDMSESAPPPPPPSWGPEGRSSCEYEVRVKTAKGKGRWGGEEGEAPPNGTGVVGFGGDAAEVGPGVEAPDVGVDADDDLALALRLSLEEEEARQRRVREEEEEEEVGMSANGNGEEYPPLEIKGKGKGKWI